VKDLARARRALSFGDYSSFVFYSQQAAEKCTKALLENKRRVVCNHDPELISEFYDAFREELGGDLSVVVEVLEFLTEYYSRSRYPFLLRGEVLGPEDVVTRDTAERGLKLAERVVEWWGIILGEEVLYRVRRVVEAFGRELRALAVFGGGVYSR
jgi:HEPN domain-containing protein